MTPLIAVWLISLGFCLGLLLDDLLHLYGHTPDDWNIHADEAVDVSRPLGPEDRADWGDRW